MATVLDSLQGTIREIANHVLISLIKWASRVSPPDRPSRPTLTFLRLDAKGSIMSLVYQLGLSEAGEGVALRSIVLTLNGTEQAPQPVVDGQELKFEANDVVSIKAIDTNAFGVDSDPSPALELTIPDPTVKPATPGAPTLTLVRVE